MPQMIYLQEIAPRGEIRGHVVGCTLPLQPVMRKRWDEGDLRRVTESGDPWPGGDVLPDAEADSDAVEKDAPVLVDTPGDRVQPAPFADGSDEPERPRGNGSQEAWAQYVVKLGSLSEEEASGMTRDELVAAVPATGDAHAR
jgi:hypothetical protein